MSPAGAPDAIILPIASTWDGGEARPDERATVAVEHRDGGLDVHIRAPLHGDPPPPLPPGPTWGLWEHEVVELFVLGPGERYTEVEVGPHGHHLLLRLEGRRHIVERCLPLDVTIERDDTTWAARFHLPADLLPLPPWRANAYAIHGTGAARRYLAHHGVPGDAPDFHRLETFPPLPWRPGAQAPRGPLDLDQGGG